VFARGDGELRNAIAVCFERDLFDHALTATVRSATPDERAPSLVVVSVSGAAIPGPSQRDRAKSRAPSPKSIITVHEEKSGAQGLWISG